MKKNLDLALKQLDGSPAFRDRKEITQREIIAEALSAQHDQPDVQRKLLFGKLAFKLALGSGEMEFALEELVAMKEAVGKSCGPLIVCQIFETLDQ